MDTLSSSFLSTIPFQNLLPNTSKHTIKPCHPRGPFLIISSVTINKERCPNPPLPLSIFGPFFDFIKGFIDHPLKPWMDPRHVLSGNFAPVCELAPTECEIEFGSLPTCLDGAYIRNGPNPQFPPQGQYHMFDGDGMLHSIQVSQGQARLCSRYVKTYKYEIEHKHGYAVVPNIFSGFDGLVRSVASSAQFAALTLSGNLNPSNGIGLANTSLAFFGDKLYALYEGDMPYSMRLTPDGDIETLGRHNFDKGYLSKSMTAHPKIDPETKEAFAFRYGFLAPYLTYFRFDSEGRKQPEVPIFSMTGPSFLHDFAITKKYAIFADIQIEMNALKMVVKGGSPFELVQKKMSRIGIIPRYASDESGMKWFDVAADFNIIHAVNAWNNEDGSIVELIVVNAVSGNDCIERVDLVHSIIERVRIDMWTGFMSRMPLSKKNVELVVLNPAYVGRQNRFVYAAIGGLLPKVIGVVKVDMSSGDHEECIVASRMYGPGCFGSEPFFVAREPENPEADEDDGVLVSYVHDERSGESRFLVMDAKSIELDIVASVKLPQRVPYGFHGLFVKESDLKKAIEHKDMTFLEI